MDLENVMKQWLSDIRNPLTGEPSPCGRVAPTTRSKLFPGFWFYHIKKNVIGPSGWRTSSGSKITALIMTAGYYYTVVIENLLLISREPLLRSFYAAYETSSALQSISYFRNGKVFQVAGNINKLDR